jgi:multidrug resistance efflux pump
MLAALLLCISAAAMAEEPAEAVSGKGMITAPKTIHLLAPMGGQLKDFSWQAGDRAEADMLALEVLPARVCAPNDGVIVGLNAQAGDQADAVQMQ